MITLIANLKGGTGKSTVNFNVALWLAVHRRKVRLFDLDPQQTLTDVIELRRDEGYTPDLELHHDYRRLKNNADPSLEVLVDIGTADYKAMSYAVQRADKVVIPVTPSQADVWSTQRFLRLIAQLRKGAKMPKILGFINRADTHLMIRETAETAEALTLLPDMKLLKSRLHQRTAFRRSFSEGLSVFEMTPASKAAAELNQLAEEIIG
jgi:chromosome partitioning protein